MNIMMLDNYSAKIEYDPELDQFRGEILGLNGGADFYGRSPQELRKEFKKSLKVYLEVCKEKEIAPTKNFSGKFNLRVSKLSITLRVVHDPYRSVNIFQITPLGSQFIHIYA